MSANPPPSCEDLNYDIVLTKVNYVTGDEFILSRGQSRIIGLNYNRVLDDVSTAQVDLFVPSKDCGGELDKADHWNTNLTIVNAGEELWHGPCKKVRYRNDRVIIEAVDLLGWLNKRRVREDLYFENQDVVNIGTAVYNSTVLAIDPPDTIQHLFPAGVLETREALVSQNRKGWGVISEMLDAGLDVTTFGRQIFWGIPDDLAVLQMTDKDFVNPDIEVVKDGDDMATWVGVDAQNETAATYPPGPPDGHNGYPLLEETFSDSQIIDVPSAEHAAEARYEWTQYGVRRVEANGGLTLSPQSPINPRLLLAGTPVTFTATECCYDATETLRVGRIDITVAGDVESTTIDLQPLGGTLQAV